MISYRYPMLQINASSLEPFITEQAWTMLIERLALSPREAEIARRVFTDDKELAIAMSLDISPHTVRTHMERLYRKLDVRSRVELVTRLTGCFLMMTAQPGTPLAPICGNHSSGRCPFSR